MHERIAVVGCIGAGKTTLARAPGDRLGLPVVHLDLHWWQPGPYRITGRSTVARHTMPPTQFRALQQELAAGNRWIIDGGYLPDLDTRLPRATTVVWLDLPRRVCLWRLVRRHGRRRPDDPPGVRAGLGWLLVLARWVLRYPKQKRPRIQAAIDVHAPQARVLRVRTTRQAGQVLDLLTTSTPPS